MGTRGDFRTSAPGAGFGLLEVVVALLLLTVALAGVVGSLGYGAALAGAARRTRLARQLATDAALDAALAPRGETPVGSGSCTRRVIEVAAPASVGVGEARWFWIEVVCVPSGSPAGGGWRPGRAALLVAR